LLITDLAHCPLLERQKQAILFGVRAATQPQSLGEQDYTQLYDIGLTIEEIFEIVATAHLFLGVNQYTDAIALEIDQL
jgi:hypothetical protein